MAMVSTASDAVKDGEFGVKVEKKDEGEVSRKPLHVTDEKTFQGLLDNLKKARGVIAVMLMDRSGNIAKTNFNRMSSSMYCGISAHILDNAIPLIESLNSRIKFRLLRSNAGVQELLIHPVAGGQLVFVVVQNCSDRASIAISCRPEEKKTRRTVHGTEAQPNEQPNVIVSTSATSATRIGSVTGDKPHTS